jgi:hypothetical protein
MNPNHAMHIAVLDALSRVLADLPSLVAILAGADDEDDAVGRLRQAYDLTPVQARAVLDAQLRLATRARRAAVDAELGDVRDALDTPWDPPLEVLATVHSPQLVEVVIAGVEHRIEGADLDDCLSRVVSVVWAELARPQRRRVTVRTGLTDGPTRVLVDPIGSAEFHYDGAAGDR